MQNMKDKNLQVIDSCVKFSRCRPLGAWEKILWLSDQSGRAQVVMVAQIKGKFSLEQLKLALNQVQERHLLLRVRIALDEAQQPWFVEDTSNNIPLRVVPREGEQQWQREVEQELSQRFVSYQAPLVRVVLIHSTDVSELIITSHHSISDGTSKLLLIRDILQALATPETFTSSEPLAIIPAMEDLIPGQVDENLVSQNSETQKTTWLSTSSLSTKLTSPLTQFSNATASKTSQILPNIHFASLSAENTTQLVSRCRQEQTSVHAAICSAFLLAIANQNSEQMQQTLQCFSAINIREDLRPAVVEQFGYYAHGKATLQTLNPNDSLWETARSFKDKINEEIAPEKVFEDLLRNQEWLSTNPDLTQVQKAISEHLDRGLIVSNLGRIKFSPEFGHLQLQAVYAPIGIPPGENQWVVGAVTVGQQLFLTLVLQNSTVSSVEREDLLAQTIDLLNTAIK